MNLQLRGREQGSWELGGARRAELPAGAVMQKGSQGDWGVPLSGLLSSARISGKNG